MLWHRFVAAVVLGALVWLPRVSPADASCDPLLQGRVASARHPLLSRPAFDRIRDAVRELLSRSAGAPLWLVDGVPTPQALAVARQLAAADAKGLSPGDYDGALWEGRLAAAQTLDPCARADLDLAFSVALMRYVHDLRMGRVDPRQLGIQLNVDAKRRDFAAFLQQLAHSGDVEAALATLEPPFARYRALLAALARYRGLAADSQLEVPLHVPAASVHPGDRYDDLGGLVYRLRQVGDLAPAAGGGPGDGVYSGDLVAAVKRFQGRHGIARDGILGRVTFAELNAGMAARVRQIRLTLERWRWMPDHLGHRPLVINIPEFHLYAFEDNGADGYRLALGMDVIVGRSFARYRTPLFRGRLSYIIFAPYWFVPASIQRRELYPKIAANPDYLAENHLQIVEDFRPASPALPVNQENIERLGTLRLRLRQPPGPDNALGVAKFMFPNTNSVYLHGTPAKKLFVKYRRDFSHGCIRVADPARLAAYVLKEEPGWDRTRVDALIASGKRLQVNLRHPLEVFVLYGTAVADPDGTVRFFRDIYRHDARLARTLARLGEAP
jgi:murein L,D-transpeptidase YcbB/YkuD